MSQATTTTASIYAGEDVSITVNVKDTDGNAEDITGMSFSYKVWKGSSAAVLTKTTGSGITLTTPASGVLTISMADTDTDALTPATYKHELKITDDGSGNEEVVMVGTLTILESKHAA